MENLSIKKSILKLNKKILIAGIIISSVIWLINLTGLLFGIGDEEKGDIIGFLIIWPIIYFIVVLFTSFGTQISKSGPFKKIFNDSTIIIFLIQLVPLCGLPFIILMEIGKNIICKF